MTVNRFRIGAKGLSRFQIGSAKSKSLSAKEAIPFPQALSIDHATDFVILAKVMDVQYQIYEACPLPKGMDSLLCNKKLNEKRHCTSCKRTIKAPEQKLFLHIKLQDVHNPPFTSRYTVAFQPIAEAFLGMKAEEMKQMEDEKLESALESKIGYIGLFKVRTKNGTKTGYDHKMNWHLVRFNPLDKDEMTILMHEMNENEEEEEVEEPKAKKAKMGKKGKKNSDGEEDDEEVDKICKKGKKKKE